jgi:hypothetical protein
MDKCRGRELDLLTEEQTLREVPPPLAILEALDP